MATEKLVNGHTANWHAYKALAQAVTKSGVHKDPAKQVQTLKRGIATAQRWMDGTHEKLS
jgi:hypothetical protein